MERIKQVSEEDYAIGHADGWDEFECTHGYGVFYSYYPTWYGDIKGAHIERIDIMAVWNSDTTAANHAEMHEGIKIIRDIPNLCKVFLDTPENREIIMKQIKEKISDGKS